MFKNKIINKQTTSITLVVLFFLFIFLLIKFGSSLLNFTQKTISQTGSLIAKTSDNVFSVKNLTKEDLDNLADKVNSLAVEKAELERLKKENITLKDSLNFTNRRKLRPVGATIIARSNSSQNSSFVIDKGKEDGIFVGVPVIVGDGLFAGKVIKVNKNTSTVKASTDIQHATAVSILNESSTIGIAKGMSGNLIHLKFIPNEQKIDINNLVVTSGLEENIPSGLIVGVVNSVTIDETAPFQEAIVEPLISLNKYSTVIALLQLEI